MTAAAEAADAVVAALYDDNVADMLKPFDDDAHDRHTDVVVADSHHYLFHIRPQRPKARNCKHIAADTVDAGADDDGGDDDDNDDADNSDDSVVEAVALSM